MFSRIWLKLAEVLVPVILAITIYVSWQADRRDRAQLASQLAVAQKAIADATTSQHDRDAALSQTLAQIASQKQAALSTEEILKALPTALPLPSPLALKSNVPLPNTKTDSASLSGSNQPGQITVNDSSDLPNNPAPKSNQQSDAVLPAADLKPLYDFALDCKACQAKLAAAQSDLADEKTKSAALAQERDAALKAAKGGSALHRIARAAKWFAIGAAAGAVAAKAAR